MPRWFIIIAIILTAKEWILLGDSAFDIGQYHYAQTCYLRALTMEVIK